MRHLNDRTPRKPTMSISSNIFPNHSHFVRATVRQVSLDTSVPVMLEGLDFSRVLFLDIDGVLHPSDYAPRAGQKIELFQSARELDNALEIADPGHRMPIVICSDWRLDTSLQNLRAQFLAATARRIVGVTPDLLGAGGSRATEVKAWMTLHAPQSEWLAIDDHPNWYGENKNKVFDVPGKERGGPGELDAQLSQYLTSRLVQFLKPAEPKSNQLPLWAGRPLFLAGADKTSGLFAALNPHQASHSGQRRPTAP